MITVIMIKMIILITKILNRIILMIMMNEMILNIHVTYQTIQTSTKKQIK